MTIDAGTGALLAAIADAAPFERRLDTPVRAIAIAPDRVEVTTRDGERRPRPERRSSPFPSMRWGRSRSTPALPEDKQAAIALGQASRGIKIMLRVRGERLMQNAIRPGHPFGYLGSEELDGDGTQLMIGFGPDAAHCDATDLPRGPAPARRDPPRLRAARRDRA